MTNLALKSLDELKAAESTLAEELDLARKLLDKHSRKVSMLVARRNKLSDELNKRALAEMGDTPDWPLLLSLDPSSGHRATSAKLESLLFEMTAVDGQTGLSTSGYLAESQQHALQVSLVQTDSTLTAKVVAALELILPSVAPVSERAQGGDVKYKHISVFEHTLSLYTSYHLRIDEELGVYELRSGSLNRKPCHKADSLLALLTYVQKNHPYIPENPESESDD